MASSLRFGRSLAPALAAAIAIAIAGCGSDEADLPVSAATSLKAAFESYGEKFEDANAQFSFAGSDELAAQIRAGAKPDVFAAANKKLPDQLYEEGLVEKPTVFATNQLVIAIPANRRSFVSMVELAAPGTKIAIGSETVPVGAYTRKVLGRLDSATRAGILGNVRSNEPDVGGISAKLTQGAVDAGFLYITDVEAANGRLKALPLPASLQPEVAYAVAVVKGAKHRAAAETFVAGLLDGDGATALRAAGFKPPPP